VEAGVATLEDLALTDPASPPCRFCGASLERTFVDLGLSPLANSYVETGDLQAPEAFYPLHVFVCERCLLVQLPEAARPEEIFSDYAYFSSVSTSWVEHARRYAEAMIERFRLGPEHRVVEIASNDGYLLRHFRERPEPERVPVLGIEPAANIADAARQAGIPTECAFFSKRKAEELAGRGVSADLLVGNNVLAHVPALNDFVAGLATLLAEGGVVTMEFPHLLRLMEENQFDTIYHEHFSYFSFTVVREVFAAHALELFDVEELPTHGGSLRIFGRHADRDRRDVGDLVGGPPGPRVAELLAREEAAGLLDPATYEGFGEQVRRTKRALLRFLLDAKRQGKRIVGYGAPAKGNTLLNYCGVRTDFLDFTVDRSPHKQGRFLPGTRIPILAPEALREARPDYVLILPWNLRQEIVEQMSDVRSWGGRFVVAIPEVEVLP